MQVRLLFSGEKAVLKWDGSNWQKVNGISLPSMAKLIMSANMTGLSNSIWYTMELELESSTGAFSLDAFGLKGLRPIKANLRGVVRAFNWTGSNDTVGALIQFRNAAVNDTAMFSPWTASGSNQPMTPVQGVIDMPSNEVLELRGSSTVSWTAYGNVAGTTTILDVMEVPQW